MRSIAFILASLLTTTVALADPSGSYSVEGKSPDGSAYKGAVVISKTGDTYKVVWTIGGDKYTGTAVGDDSFLAVTYKAGGDAGLAVYGREGTGWKGVWTMLGGTKLGAERLTRK